MGLIKNWADSNGTKHQVDPTGHNHSNDSWFTTAIAACEKIANKITSWGTPTNTQYPSAKLVKDSLDAKAENNHTHSTSESWLSTIVNNLTTLINGKAPLSNPDFTGRVYCASGHFDEVYGDDENGLDIKPSVDSIYGISLTNDGGITIDGEVVEGEAVDTTPTANSQRLITSGAVATALSGKANSSHTHSQSDITGLSTALTNKLSSSVHEELLNSQSAKKNLSAMTIGDLYLFINNYSKQLSQIINNDVTGAHLYFHQGAGSIATDHIMVRIYKWVSPDGNDERLCEIVGAWDA